MEHGADLFGIAGIDRFEKAPRGFHPKDIYANTASVIVFAIGLPTEALFAESLVPYSHLNTLAIQKVDQMTFAISTALDRIGVKNVLVPSDDPYEFFDIETQHGQGILSMRHAAALAGLGRIGRNALLINKDFGNMLQIGALLTSEILESDPLADYEVCPPRCMRCLDACPSNALTGTRVVQFNCRQTNAPEHSRGFDLKRCFECRKVCPHATGIRHPKTSST